MRIWPACRDITTGRNNFGPQRVAPIWRAERDTTDRPATEQIVFRCRPWLASCVAEGFNVRFRGDTRPDDADLRGEAPIGSGEPPGFPNGAVGSVNSRHGRQRPVYCSDGSDEFGEDQLESVVQVETEGQLVVSAAQVSDERMSALITRIQRSCLRPPWV